MPPSAPTATTPGDGPGKRTSRRGGVLLLAIAAAALLVAGIAVAVYTERPAFCPVCHEMRPYYDAWASGPHANTSCVDCHVDAGIVNHALHKFVALKEVWDHFTRDNRFPTWGVELPNARCVRCHPTVRTLGGSKFDHQLHADKALCKDCHATAGHRVSIAALDAAGVLNTATTTTPPVPVRMTPSSAAGHILVPCQRCHDQAKMHCSQCHSAPHEARGECSDCHSTGARFVFAHPAAPDCSRCHKPPHSARGECSQCHKVGPTFAFVHPTATDCGRCHKAPANHFGPSCAACHRPGVAFASATFRHPGNTGEHSYRSFACVKCHPKSYSVASCTCHGGRPPQGD